MKTNGPAVSAEFFSRVCDHKAVCMLHRWCSRMRLGSVPAPMGAVRVRSEQPMNGFHLNRPHNHNYCIRCRVVSRIKTYGTIVIVSSGDTNFSNNCLHVPCGLHPLAPPHTSTAWWSYFAFWITQYLPTECMPSKCFCPQYLSVFSNCTAVTRCIRVINHCKQVTVLSHILTKFRPCSLKLKVISVL